MSEDLKRQAAEWEAAGKDPSEFMARLILSEMGKAGMGFMAGLIGGVLTASKHIGAAAQVVGDVLRDSAVVGA